MSAAVSRARPFGQRLEHGIGHSGREPSSVASKQAVPFAILVRQVSPLCAGPRDPNHTFKIGRVVLRRPAATPTLRRQQRPDWFPLAIRYPDPIAQRRFQKATLNQNTSLRSSVVHEAQLQFMEAHTLLSKDLSQASTHSTYHVEAGRWNATRIAARARYPAHEIHSCAVDRARR